jgi:hypothetical protein
MTVALMNEAARACSIGLILKMPKFPPACLLRKRLG